MIKAYAGLNQEAKALKELGILKNWTIDNVPVSRVEFASEIDFEALSIEEAEIVIDGEPMPIGMKITLIVIGILFLLFVIVMIATGNGDALLFGLFMAAVID